MEERTRAIVQLAGAIAGFALGGACFLRMPPDKPLPLMLTGVAALVIGAACLTALLNSRNNARRARRLMDGEGLVARWHVTAAEWDRFRQLDAAWARGGGQRLFRPAARTPDCGVDIFVAEEAVVVDGTWLSLRPLGTTGPADIAWLPTEPECIEVCHIGGSDTLVLQTFRFPVPAEAKDAGRRLFERWDRIVGSGGREEFRHDWNYDPFRGMR